MKAIYKRELRSYFSSVIAWIFVAATTLISGIFFVLYNLMQGYPSLEPPIFYAAMGLALFIPVLTMKVMADERRQKTDQLILTSQISLFKVVMGKYCALLTIFAIPTIIIGVYPFIMSAFGTVNYKLAYTTLLGFFLYGAALIAIGVFISSITEMQIIAAIISIVIMFLGFFMGSITGMISQEGNIATDILNAFNTMGPLNDIMSGEIALSHIVYYLSIVVLFLFLTCQSVQKRRWSTSKTTIGTSVFSTLTIVIVLVLVVFVNLLATGVTNNVTAAKIDTTSTGIYSITKKTEKMLSKLDKDINIYVLGAKNSLEKEIYTSYIVKTLDRYETSSKHIKVEYKNTKTNPNFYKKYASESPTEGSVIVENKQNKKSKVIDFNDMFEMAQQAAMYGQQSSPTAYDAEGQIDSAIAYVQSDETFTVYQVEGHKETLEDQQMFGGMENLTEIIQKHNCVIKKINLATKEAQNSLNTDKCDVLLLMGPQKDYTKNDAKLVKKYLEEGGKVIASYENSISFNEDKPNYNSIFESFNIKVGKGVVAENDSNYYAAQYNQYFAFAKGTEGFANNLPGMVFSPFSIGLNKKDKNYEDVTYTGLATSTKSAVLKKHADTAEVPTKQKGDISGKFDFVVSAEKNTAATEKSSIGTDKADTKKAEILLFSSVYSLFDNADDSVSGSDLQIVNNALDEYINTDVVNVTIPKKSLQMTQLQVSANAVRICMIVLVIVLPLVLLVAGIVIWALRRKK